MCVGRCRRWCRRQRPSHIVRQEQVVLANVEPSGLRRDKGQQAARQDLGRKGGAPERRAARLALQHRAAGMRSARAPCHATLLRLCSPLAPAPRSGSADPRCGVERFRPRREVVIHHVDADVASETVYMNPPTRTLPAEPLRPGSVEATPSGGVSVTVRWSTEERHCH